MRVQASGATGCHFPITTVILTIVMLSVASGRDVSTAVLARKGFPEAIENSTTNTVPRAQRPDATLNYQIDSRDRYAQRGIRSLRSRYSTGLLKPTAEG